MMSSANYAKPVVRSNVEVSPYEPRDVCHMWRRFAAWMIDATLLGVVVAVALHPLIRPVAVLVTTPSHKIVALNFLSWRQVLANSAFDYGLVVGIATAYFSALEWAFGWTIGKLIFGLRVVDFAGGSLTFGQALVRNLLRVIDGLPFGLYLLGWVAALAGDRRQRLGDKGAGTLVVGRKSVVRLKLIEKAATTPSFLSLRQI